MHSPKLKVKYQNIDINTLKSKSLLQILRLSYYPTR